MGDKQEYEVEFKSTTWRVVRVEAKSEEEAEEKAWQNLWDDYDISKAWEDNAEVSTIWLDNKEVFCNDGTITIQKDDKSNKKP